MGRQYENMAAEYWCDRKNWINRTETVRQMGALIQGYMVEGFPPSARGERHVPRGAARPRRDFFSGLETSNSTSKNTDACLHFPDRKLEKRFAVEEFKITSDPPCGFHKPWAYGGAYSIGKEAMKTLLGYATWD